MNTNWRLSAFILGILALPSVARAQENVVVSSPCNTCSEPSPMGNGFAVPLSFESTGPSLPSLPRPFLVVQAPWPLPHDYVTVAGKIPPEVKDSTVGEKILLAWRALDSRQPRQALKQFRKIKKLVEKNSPAPALSAIWLNWTSLGESLACFELNKTEDAVELARSVARSEALPPLAMLAHWALAHYAAADGQSAAAAEHYQMIVRREAQDSLLFSGAVQELQKLKISHSK